MVTRGGRFYFLKYITNFLLLLNIVVLIFSELLYFVLEGLTGSPTASLMITVAMAILILSVTPDVITLSADDEPTTLHDFVLKGFTKYSSALDIAFGFLLFTLVFIVFVLIPISVFIGFVSNYGIPRLITSAIILIGLLIFITHRAKRHDGGGVTVVYVMNPFFYLRGYGVYVVEYKAKVERFASTGGTRYKTLAEVDDWLMLVTFLDLDEDDFKNVKDIEVYQVEKRLFVL